MKLIAGILVAVVGLLVSLQSIAGIFPGLTSTGVFLILFGGLIIGLSFVAGPDSQGIKRMTTPSTLLNIFVSPSETFQNLRRHPRWLVAVLIMAVLSSTYSLLFVNKVTVERVTNYTIDKTLEMSILNDEAKLQIESGRGQAIEDAKNPMLRAGQAISGFVGTVFGYAFLAVMFLLFVLAFGGTINYWQAFSAVVYAVFPLAVLRFVLNTVVLYLKEATEIHPIIGQSSLIQDNLSFLVVPGENPIIYTLLASLSILTFYWVWLQATGLKNSGENVSGSTAWTSSLIVYGAMILLGVTAAFLFPSFIS